MIKTCANCIHRELCNVHGYIDADECGCFKDKDRFIELPCAVGDYVRFKGLTSLWKVDGIHFYREGLPQFNAISPNGKVTTTFTELDSFEVMSKEDAKMDGRSDTDDR